MRISPLHNIRQQGLIPNGFPKEQAPPPAPDPAMQPEMRNRVEAQSDTRHAVEFLNPRTRLEANGINRSNTVEAHAAYERLLRILLGHDRAAQQAVSQVDAAALKHPPAGTVSQRDLHPEVNIQNKSRDRYSEENKPGYYQRRCVEAYRSAQAMEGANSTWLKV